MSKQIILSLNSSSGVLDNGRLPRIQATPTKQPYSQVALAWRMPGTSASVGCPRFITAIRLLGISAAAILLIDSQAAQAQLYWSASSGDWSVASNWGGTVPSGSDNAYITNGGTANITHLGQTCGTLLVGNGTGSGSVQMSGGSLSVTSAQYVGATGNGIFVQSGGTSTIGGTLVLSQSAGSDGTYRLSGTGWLSVPVSYVGYSGLGTFTQTGGTTNVTNSLRLGSYPGSNGSYFLSGNGQVLAPLAYVGDSGTGKVSQSGGTCHFIGGLVFGNGATGSGTFDLTGNGQLFSASITLGYAGTGNFTHSGGINAVTNQLELGSVEHSSGTYVLGENGELSAASETIGYAGTGLFMQTGGTNATGSIGLGQNAGANGSYILSGGGLVVTSSVTVGDAGSGSFIQSGGTSSVTTLDVGYYYSSGSGIYNLSDSGQLSAVDERLGYYLGSGTISQSGGKNTIANELSISSKSKYLLAGGTLQVNGGLSNQGVFDGGKLSATLIANCLLNISSGTWQNLNALSVNMGPNSLLIVPAEFDTANDFASYISLGLTHTAGTTIVLAAGSGFGGAGTIQDFIDCQGSIAAVSGDGINLSGGLLVSGSGYANLGIGVMTVNDSASGIKCGTLVVGDVFVGNGGNGVFNQEGGTSAIAGHSLYLAFSTGSSGTYTLGGGQLSASCEYLGHYGTGTFSQSGGTNAVADYVDIGYNSGSHGSYNLTGDGVFSASDIHLGLYGNGTFTQSAGTAAFASSLFVGYNSGSSGKYLLAGNGQLSASNAYVGYSGSGTFTQSGGTNTVTSAFYLAYKSGSKGTYSLNGGLLAVPSVYRGSGTGVFNLNGGTLQATASNYSSFMSGLSNVYIQAGGAIIDTQGFSDGIDQSLLHDPTLGSIVDGGLCKVGSGTLLLAGTNSYTGRTVVAAGLLQVAGTSSLPGYATAGKITVSSGAGLIVSTAGSGWTDTSISALFGSNGSGFADGMNFGINTSGGSMSCRIDFTGNLGMMKLGGNQLILTGSNTYAGATIVSGGTLQIGNGGNGASIGNTSGVTDNATLAFNHGDTVTFSPAISGSGSLTQSGSGVLVLTHSNSYTGTTTISGGLLCLGNSAALAGGGSITFGGGTMQFTGSNCSDYSIRIVGSKGPIALDTNGLSISLASNLASSNYGGLAKIGDGTLTLAASTAFTGSTIVRGGTLALGSPQSLQWSTLDTSGSGFLSFGPLTTATLGGLSGTGQLKLSNAASAAVLLYAGLNNIGTTYSGTLVGAGSLQKVGYGKLLLSGSNTYSGSTRISDGVLALANSAALASTGSITFSGGTLQYSSSNNQDYSGKIVGSSQPISIDTNGVNVIFASSLTSSNSGGLTKGGSGLLLLSGSNSYAGLTTVGSGTLQVASPLALPGYATFGKVIMKNASMLTLSVGGSGWSAADISTLLESNDPSFSSGSMLGIDTSNGSLTYASNVPGKTGLAKMGSNSLVLAGTNTYSGLTNVTAGTLQVTSTASLPGIAATGRVSVAGGATLAVSAGGSGWSSASISSLLTSNGSGFSNGSLLGIGTTAGDFSYDSNIAGGMGLTKLGGNSLTLSGSNTYTGGTLVTAGVLVVTTPTALRTGTSLTVGAGAISIFGSADGPMLPQGNAPSAVPEPSTLALLCVGAVGLLSWSRRGKRSSFRPQTTTDL
jgi:fibronectin-binding autotransporter adhesin